jgi:hypothetical protein
MNNDYEDREEVEWIDHMMIRGQRAAVKVSKLPLPRARYSMNVLSLKNDQLHKFFHVYWSTHNGIRVESIADEVYRLIKEAEGKIEAEIQAVESERAERARRGEPVTPKPTASSVVARRKTGGGRNDRDDYNDEDERD